MKSDIEIEQIEAVIFNPLPKLDELINQLKETVKLENITIIDALIEVRNELQWRKET